jgi:hypothetical protein
MRIGWVFDRAPLIAVRACLDLVDRSDPRTLIRCVLDRVEGEYPTTKIDNSEEKQEQYGQDQREFHETLALTKAHAWLACHGLTVMVVLPHGRESPSLGFCFVIV